MQPDVRPPIVMSPEATGAIRCVGASGLSFYLPVSPVVGRPKP